MNQHQLTTLNECVHTGWVAHQVTTAKHDGTSVHKVAHICVLTTKSINKYRPNDFNDDLASLNLTWSCQLNHCNNVTVLSWVPDNVNWLQCSKWLVNQRRNASSICCSLALAGESIKIMSHNRTIITHSALLCQWVKNFKVNSFQ